MYGQQGANLVSRNPQPVINNTQDRFNLTHVDLSNNLGSVTSRGGLNVEFFYDRIRIGNAFADEVGRFETRLYVALQPKGDRLTIAIEQITEAQAAQRFPADWNYFKNSQDVPTAGTPLNELPGISQSMIAILVLNGIRSIEDLIGIPQDVVSQIGLDATTARKIGIEWMARKTGSREVIDTSAKQAEMEQAMHAMQKRLAAMEQVNIEKEATIRALQSVAGRPMDDMPQAMSANSGVMRAAGEEDYSLKDAPDVFALPSIVGGNEDLGMNDVNPLE